MKLESAVMKTGNSLSMVIPKTISDIYKIEKGDKVKIFTTEKGLFIPLEPIKLPTLKDVLKGDLK